MATIFTLIGALGILLISIGIVVKKRKTQDIYYVLGGLCLEAYSIYTRYIIFIVRQVIFPLAAAYDFAKLQFVKK